MEEKRGYQGAESDDKTVGEAGNDGCLAAEHGSQCEAGCFLWRYHKSQPQEELPVAQEGQSLKERCVDGPEDGGGDADGRVEAFDAQCPRISIDETLGAAVHSDYGPVHPGRDGRDVEDVALALFLHEGQQFPAKQQRGGAVQGDDAAEFLRVGLLDGRLDEHSGIVDENLHAPAVLAAAVHDAVRCVGLREVGTQDGCRYMVLADKLMGELLRGISVDVNQQDSISHPGQLRGVLPPHA